jgi:hypothetical protein
VLDEATLFRDLGEVLRPGFEVTDASGELDTDLTMTRWFFLHRALLRGGEK